MSLMTVEENFVILCACVTPDDRRQIRIRETVLCPMDWERVYDISLQQRTFPLLYRNLENICPENIPENIYKKLQNAFNNNLKRNLFMSAYLVKIITFFQSHGILVVPFKGPVLEKDIFGDTGLRVYSDLDLFIKQEDAVNAWILLVANGFEPEFSLNESKLKNFTKYINDIAFYNRKTDTYIELHWELTGNYLFNPLVIGSISEDLESIPSLSDVFPTFSPELLLLYLCIHGAKHEWEYLELVCCIDGVIRRKNLDWIKLETLAERWRAERMLDLGIYLSWKLLGTKIPPDMISRIEKESVITRLYRYSINKMFHLLSSTKNKKQFTRSSRFHFEIRDTFSDRVRYFLRLVFRPAKADWVVFHLPSIFLFSLYLLRPCRLVFSFLSTRSKMYPKGMEAH